MRHVISALVVNEPGVLASVAGMFAARGFNIDSLVVGRTDDANVSRMTIVVDADENTLEQVRKQLAKLVPVTKVKDFKGSSYIERDLALVTISASPQNRGEVIEVVKVELAGTEQKIEAFVELMKPYGIRELARTGVIAMSRGAQSSRDAEAPLSTAPDSGKRKRSLDAPAAVALPPS